MGEYNKRKEIKGFKSTSRRDYQHLIGVIIMEGGSPSYWYFLGYTNSWEEHEKMSDLAFYSNCFLRDDVYLLSCGKSWEFSDNISDLSCYSDCFLKRRKN